MNIYKELSKRLDQVFDEQAMYLCDLDRCAGDGDHGLTISRGFHTAYELVCGLNEDVKASQVCKTIGHGMLKSMGGASGPIFSTFFIQAAIILNEREILDGEALKEILARTIDAIHDLANTNRGEKTMLDALYGAYDAVCCSEGALWEAARQGAKKGAESTKAMMATKGRAKFLQERSIGFMDAGSWSVFLILDTMASLFGEVS